MKKTLFLGATLMLLVFSSYAQDKVLEKSGKKTQMG